MLMQRDCLGELLPIQPTRVEQHAWLLDDLRRTVADLPRHCNDNSYITNERMIDNFAN